MKKSVQFKLCTALNKIQVFLKMGGICDRYQRKIFQKSRGYTNLITFFYSPRQLIKDLLKIPVRGLTPFLPALVTLVRGGRQPSHTRMLNLLSHSRQKQGRSREEISTRKYLDVNDPDDKLNLSICQVLQSIQKHTQMPKDIKSPHKPR